MKNGKSISQCEPQNRQEVILGSEHPLNFNSPILDSFFNSSIGFDDVFDRLFKGVPKKLETYPPYNLFKLDNGYLLEMAVAGFSRKDISIYREEQNLIIESIKPELPQEIEESDTKSIIHQGLALRSFKQVLRISDLIEVQEARLEDGILRIRLNTIKPKPPNREYVNIE